jgi:hypothetical protein
MSQVEADFDRIALLPHDGWNHNRDYDAFLLKQMPESFGAALDVGCGTGAFSRLLAQRCDHVLAAPAPPLRQPNTISARPQTLCTAVFPLCLSVPGLSSP